MKETYTEKAQAESRWWLYEDVRILKKIYKLLDDIKRHPYTGLGHPEPLKHKLSGWWSRHIDDENRLVYRIIEGDTDEESFVEIRQCKGHYSDN